MVPICCLIGSKSTFKYFSRTRIFSWVYGLSHSFHINSWSLLQFLHIYTSKFYTSKQVPDLTFYLVYLSLALMSGCGTVINQFNKLVQSGEAGQVLFKRTREQQLTLTRFISAMSTAPHSRACPGSVCSPLLASSQNSSSTRCFGYTPAA